MKIEMEPWIEKRHLKRQGKAIFGKLITSIRHLVRGKSYYVIPFYIASLASEA